MLAEVTAVSVSSALADVSDVLGSAITAMSGQPVLLAILGCGLAGIGFKLFKRAKRSVA